MPQTASMPIPQLPQPDLTPACMTDRCRPGPVTENKRHKMLYNLCSCYSDIRRTAFRNPFWPESQRQRQDCPSIPAAFFLKKKQASRVPGNLPAVRRSRSQSTSPPFQGTRRDDSYKNPGVPSTHFFFQRGFPTLPFSASHLLIRRIGFHRFSHSLPAFCTEDGTRFLVSVTPSSARPVRAPSAKVWRRERLGPSLACSIACTRALMLQLSLGEVFFFLANCALP